MTKAPDDRNNRFGFATTGNPKGLKDGGGGHGTIALSEELFARGHAVLIDGALPSLADALCMLGPPFGDGYGVVHRFIDIWERQPLARSFDTRQALDDVSVDDDDLGLLRDLLTRDLALAPKSARAPIEQAIIQLDVSLAWTLGGGAAMALAGLAACHAHRVSNPDERLLAAATAIALAGAGSPGHRGFPAHGVRQQPASSSEDVALGFVADVERLLRAFADRHMKAFASSPAILAAAEAHRATIVAGEIRAILRDVPLRLSFVDGNDNGVATFASLVCPGRAAAIEPSATERCEQLHQDCRTWAIQEMTSHSDALPLVDGLMELMGTFAIGASFTVCGLNAALETLDMLPLRDDPDDPLAARFADIVSRVRFRLHIYAAHLGDPAAAAKLAAWSAGYALMNMNRAEGWPMLVAALGWAERSAIAHPAALSSARALGLPDVDVLLAESVSSRLDAIAADLAYALSAVAVVRQGDVENTQRTFEELWRASVATGKEARRSIVAAVKSSEATAVDESAIVVVRSIAQGQSYGDKQLHTDWASWVGKPAPLVPTGNIQKVYRKLVAEAPHARAIIDLVLRDTAASRTVAWRPTLIVGKPGSSKTFVAIRLCQELGLPHRVFSCGGVSDSSFGGTSRQWSTGRASVPLQTIREFGVGNPVVILDEIDKANGGLNRQNGSLIDVLLAMLEPLSSSRIFDLYLEGDIDLSRVLWLATANNILDLHPALLDRFRILHIEDPRADQLHAVLPGVVRAVAERRGLSPEWIAPFDAMDMEFLAELWRGGSIRRLTRIVEAMIDARDDPQRAN